MELTQKLAAEATATNMGAAAQGRLASLQLELNSAREQASDARRAQQTQAMAAARAASDASAATAQLQRQVGP